MVDVNKLFITNEPYDVEFVFEGQTFNVKVRDLTWSQKSGIIHNCLVYKKEGEARFDYEQYAKKMLMARIVQAPWGETSAIFLSKLKPAFGKMLEDKLIPAPFEGDAEEENFTEDLPSESLREPQQD